MATTTMATEFPQTQAIPEGSSRKYTATLLDLDGVGLTPGQIQSIRCTLRAVSNNQVVNARNRQEVRNAAGGTVATGGAFSLVLGTGDTIAIGTAHMQKRRLTLEVFYLSGVENHEVFFWVENLKDLPPALEGHPDAEAPHVADGAPAGALA